MPDSSNYRDVSAPHRPSVLWRCCKIGGKGLLALLLLAIAVCLVENWRGARAWSRLKADYEAKGERLDYQAFVPAPAPDADNFAATPLLADILDYDRSSAGITWRQSDAKKRRDAVSNALSNAPRKKSPRPGNWQIDEPAPLDEWQEYFVANTNYQGVTVSENPALGILRALQKFDTELAELEEASRRPRSFFQIRYVDHFNALLPQLTLIRGINGVVRLRALARLKAGQKDDALRDVQFALRLAESPREEAFIISQLVRIAMLHASIQPLWEGCARHEWSDGQLAQLQSQLASIRLLEDYGKVMRGERAFSNASLDSIRTGASSLGDFGFGDAGNDSAVNYLRPLMSGWLRHNQVSINRLHQERTIPLIDAAKHRVYVAQTHEADNMPELQSAHLYNILARTLLPAVAKTATKFAHAQAALDLAIVACALERHWLANGEYPTQLDLLVPKFIEKLPTDVINGEMLKYRRESDGSFALWSVGWNEADDHGEVGTPKNGKGHDTNLGDWVWRFTPIK